MSHVDEAIATLKSLQSAGAQIAVDDFGTGYSSLAYLKRFPIDALKIDQSFVRDVTTNADDAAIAMAIIQLAHSLGLKVIAEGVETSEQLQFLRQNRCDEMQGYFFRPPLRAEEFADLLKEHEALSYREQVLSD
jgi:EAL domain-containing protein (putative c-di-GMP-specific phosphodiesterase class I)